MYSKTTLEVILLACSLTVGMKLRMAQMYNMIKVLNSGSNMSSQDHFSDLKKTKLGLKWAGLHWVGDPTLPDLLGLLFTASLCIITAILA